MLYLIDNTYRRARRERRNVINCVRENMRTPPPRIVNSVVAVGGDAAVVTADGAVAVVGGGGGGGDGIDYGDDRGTRSQPRRLGETRTASSTGPGMRPALWTETGVGCRRRPYRRRPWRLKR